MKTKITLFLSSLVVSCHTFSQAISADIRNSDSLNLAFQAKMEEMFDNVDLSYVPNGVLYDHGFPMIIMEPYRGVITDSSKANALTFGLLYASLTSMAVDTTVALPAPDDYMLVMDTVNSNSTVIPIVGLHQEYYKIDSLAVADSLFTVIGDNLYDVFPRARSPYIKHEVFTMCPVEVYTDQASVNFYFDSNLFYTNTGKTVDSLLIDMGNGQGYLAIDFDQNIPITFSEAGKHNFKVKVVYTDASVYLTHFDITSRESATLGVMDGIPDYIHSIGANETNVGGTINVYLACGHERIEKPFIWAEAFNPSIGAVNANLTSRVILDRMEHPDGKYSGQTLLDYLTDNGYDIIILDYVDGAAALPRKAEFIKEAIRWVNIQKASGSSRAKNVILGQSMGGVATTQALREMENALEDHECETFIVFDSPLNGANIPMAAQASLLDMSTMWVNKPYSSDDRFLCQFVGPFRDLLKTLYAPATRTMLVEQCDDVIIGVGPLSGYSARYLTGIIVGRDTESLYDSYYENLHAPGNGLPQDCEVIILANGSDKGSSGLQPFSPGGVLLEANINNMVIGAIAARLLEEMDEVVPDLGPLTTRIVGAGLGVLTWVVAGTVIVDIEFRAMKNLPTYGYYHNITYVKPFWMVSPLIFHLSIVKGSYHLEVDHTPGGFFGNQNQGLFLEETVVGEALAQFNMHTYCFTPTGSVLNYKNGGNTWQDEMFRTYDNPSSDIASDLMPGVDSYYAISEGVVFVEDPGVTYNNSAHTWFTPEQTKYLLYFLVGSNELDGIYEITSGTTFNYGKSAILPSSDFEGDIPIRTSSVLDHSLIVNNTRLSVNANEAIGLSATTN